jgi:hypothetical protein
MVTGARGGRGSWTASVTIEETGLVAMSDTDRAAAVSVLADVLAAWWMKRAPAPARSARDRVPDFTLGARDRTSGSADDSSPDHGESITSREPSSMSGHRGARSRVGGL